MSVNLPSIVDHLGEVRVLGFRPAPPNAPRLAPPMALDEVIPESQWSECADLWFPGRKITDQDGKGACNAFASVAVLEDARHMAGYPDVVLSAWNLYGNITGGWDRGSYPGDALEYLRDKGVCRDTLVSYAQFNPNRFTAQAKADEGNFRAEIGDSLATRPQLVTSILLRRPSVITLCVGAAFDRLDENGCVRVGIGFDNHAVKTNGRLKRSKDGRRWCVGFDNSWTPQWGDAGRAFVYLDDLIRNNSWASYLIGVPRGGPGDDLVGPAGT